MLTFNVADKDDIWFHVANCSGSHVILHSSTKTFTLDDIQQAANLAAYYSKARAESRADVIYANINDVTKNKRGPVGAVNVDKFMIIRATPSNGSRLSEKFKT